MENILHVGNKIDKESVDNLAGGIAQVFESAFKNHISQENIETALGVFARTFEIKNVSVQGCSFIGEDNKVSVHAGNAKKEPYELDA